MLEKFFISSPIGFLEVCIKQNRLYSLSKVSQSKAKNRSKKEALSPKALLVKKQLKAYFEGDLKKFSIPLFMRGTAFQKKVWKSLQKIPYGKTKTYGELAYQLNKPRAGRAVGNCCAKNPFLLVVPCHRVLSQKGLGGFALGLKTKKYLLALENQ